MTTDATTAKEYHDALAALWKEPIIGTHEIGELTIVVSMRGWQVTDEHDNLWEGRSTSGLKARHSIARITGDWVRTRFPRG